MKLTEYVKGLKDKESDGIDLTKVDGPNGAFFSIVKADGTVITMPIGKKSQEGTIAEYNVLIAEDGTAIATINNYEDGETLTL